MAFFTVTTVAENVVGCKKEQYIFFVANATSGQVRTKLTNIESVEVNTYSLDGSTASAAAQAMGTVLNSLDGTVKAAGVIHITDLTNPQPVVLRVTGT